MYIPPVQHILEDKPSPAVLISSFTFGVEGGQCVGLSFSLTLKVTDTGFEFFMSGFTPQLIIVVVKSK